MANFAPVGLIFDVKNFQGGMAAMGQIRRQITFLGSDVTNLGGGVRDLGRNMRGLGNEMAAVGFRLSFLVSIPIVSFFGATTKAAIEFEKAATQIVNLTDASAASVRKWGQEILDIAPALGALPVDLMKGLFAITSAGLTDGKLAMDALTVSSKAASIGLGDIETVGRGVAAVMLTYADAGIDAARATDFLVSIVDQGSIEIDQLVPSIGRFLGVARTMGVELDDAGAFLAMFTRSGISADEAVTSLRAAMTTFLKPTAKAKEALASIGTSAEMVRKQIGEQGLTRTLIGLSQAFGDNVEGLAAVFGNVRALSGVLFNARVNGEQFLQIQTNIANSAGVTERAFRELTKTTAFQLEQLKAGAQTAGVAIGQILLPSINEVIQRLLPFLAGIRAFAEAHPQLVLVATAAGLATAAFSLMLIVTGLLISSIGTIIGVVGGFIAVLGSLLGPINLVVAAVIGLIGLLGVGLFESLQRSGQIAVPAFVKSYGHLSEQVEEEGQKTIKTAGATFSEMASNMFDWGANIVTSFARGMASAITAVVQVLINLGNAIAEWLAPGSPPRILPDIDEWGKEAFNEFIQGMLDADFSLLLGIGDRIAEIVSGWSLPEFDIFNQGFDAISGFLRSLVGIGVGELDIAPTLAETREALAEAIEEWQEYGEVSEDSLQRVADAMGVSSDAVTEYIGLLFDLADANEAVAEAQAEVNEITERYDALIDPIQDQVEALAESFEDAADAQRIEELRDIIASATAPAEAKAFAQQEIDLIMAQDQVEALEEQRDAELEVAEASLSAAEQAQADLEAQLELQKAVIDNQVESNQLIQEQVNLLEGLKVTLDDLKDKLGDAGLGGALGLPDPLDFQAILDDLVAKIEGPFNTLKTKMGGLWKEITDPFRELIRPGGLLSQLAETWGDVWEELTRIISENGPFINTRLIDTANAIGSLYLAVQALKLVLTTGGALAAMGGLAGVLSAIGNALLGLSFVTVFAAELFALVEFIRQLKLVGSGKEPDENSWLVKLIRFLGETDFPKIAQGIASVFDVVFADLADLILAEGLLKGLASAWKTTWLGLQDIISDWWNGGGEFGDGAKANIKDFLGQAVQIFLDATGVTRAVAGVNTLLSVWSAGWTALTTFLSTWWEGEGGLKGMLTTIVDTMVKLLDPLIVSFNGIVTAIQAIVTWIGKLADAVANFDLGALWALIGQSPSPLEAGIRGAIEAMDELVTRQLPAWQGTVGGGGGSVPTPAYAYTTTNNNRQANVNMGGITIQNGMDAAIFEAWMGNTVRRAVR